jgi:hypothetical protein
LRTIKRIARWQAAALEGEAKGPEWLIFLILSWENSLAPRKHREPYRTEFYGSDIPPSIDESE